jgi:hypothetical protein
LIERMVVANPLWRAPRIHGELKTLGIAISERTVSRILRAIPGPPTQTWKTFLHNHLGPARVDRFLYGADDHHEGAVRVHRAGAASRDIVHPSFRIRVT